MMQMSRRGAGPEVGLQVAVEFVRNPNGQLCPDLITTGDVLADGLVGVEVVVPCAQGQAVYRIATVRIVAYGPGW